MNSIIPSGEPQISPISLNLNGPAPIQADAAAPNPACHDKSDHGAAEHAQSNSSLAANALANSDKGPCASNGRVKTYTVEDLEREIAAQPRSFVVNDWIPRQAIVMLGGISGIGKSALAHTLCVCVAAGKQFMGHATIQDNVLLVDLENGKAAIVESLRRIAKFLGLTGVPDNLKIVCDRPAGCDNLARLKPWIGDAMSLYSGLVTIDSLRAFWPEALDGSDQKSDKFFNMIRELKNSFGSSILFVSHLRKQDKQWGRQSLADTPANSWFEELSGSGALNNQTDVRIGVEPIPNGQRKGDEELLLRGFTKMQGEFGPFYVGREYDSNGQAVGYKTVGGIALAPAEVQTFYAALPAGEFSLAQTTTITNTPKSTAKDRLNKLIGLGLVLLFVITVTYLRYHHAAFEDRGTPSLAIRAVRSRRVNAHWKGTAIC